MPVINVNKKEILKQLNLKETAFKKALVFLGITSFKEDKGIVQLEISYNRPDLLVLPFFKEQLKNLKIKKAYSYKIPEITVLAAGTLTFGGILNSRYVPQDFIRLEAFLKKSEIQIVYEGRQLCLSTSIPSNRKYFEKICCLFALFLDKGAPVKRFENISKTRFKLFTGTALTSSKLLALRKLGYLVEEQTGLVSKPSFRTDLLSEQDLFEDVLLASGFYSSFIPPREFFFKKKRIKTTKEEKIVAFLSKKNFFQILTPHLINSFKKFNSFLLPLFEVVEIYSGKQDFIYFVPSGFFGAEAYLSAAVFKEKKIFEIKEIIEKGIQKKIVYASSFSKEERSINSLFEILQELNLIFFGELSCEFVESKEGQHLYFLKQNQVKVGFFYYSLKYKNKILSYFEVEL